MSSTPQVSDSGAAARQAAIIREQQRQAELLAERKRAEQQAREAREQAAKLHNQGPEAQQPLLEKATKLEKRVDEIDKYLSTHEIRSKPLERGARGAQVKDWQAYLGDHGFKIDKKEIESRTFGPTTERAVKQFQKTLDLEADGVIGSQTSSAREGYQAAVSGSFMEGAGPKNGDLATERVLARAGHKDKVPELRAERQDDKDLKAGIARVKAFADGANDDPRVVAHEVRTWLDEHKDSPQAVRDQFVKGVQPALTQVADDIATGQVEDEENGRAALKEIMAAAEVAGGDQPGQALPELVTPFTRSIEEHGSSDIDIDDGNQLGGMLKAVVKDGGGTRFGVELATQLSKSESEDARSAGQDTFKAVREGVEELQSDFEDTFDETGDKGIEDPEEFDALGAKVAANQAGLARLASQPAPGGAQEQSDSTSTAPVRGGYLPAQVGTELDQLRDVAETQLSDRALHTVAATPGGQRVMVDALRAEEKGQASAYADKVRDYMGENEDQDAAWLDEHFAQNSTRLREGVAFNTFDAASFEVGEAKQDAKRVEQAALESPAAGAAELKRLLSTHDDPAYRTQLALSSAPFVSVGPAPASAEETREQLARLPLSDEARARLKAPALAASTQQAVAATEGLPSQTRARLLEQMAGSVGDPMNAYGVSSLLHSSAWQVMSAEEKGTAAQVVTAGGGRAAASLADLAAQPDRLFARSRDGKTTLDHLGQLASQPLHESIASEKPLFGEAPRAALMNGLLDELTSPDENIGQGANGTCGPAAIQYGLVGTRPAEYARLIAGLSGPEGKVKMLRGDELSIQPDVFEREGESRSISEALFQSSAMEYVGGILDYDAEDDTRRVPGIGLGLGSGISGGQAANLIQQLFDEDYDATATGHKIPGVQEVKDLFSGGPADDRQLEFFRSYEREPGDAPILLGFKSPAHFVTFDHYENGRVYFHNQWGTLGPEAAKQMDARVEDPVRGIMSVTDDQFRDDTSHTMIPQAVWDRYES